MRAQGQAAFGTIPGELIQAVRRHQVIPFAGAGVSLGTKPGLFPDWRALLQGLAEELVAQCIPDAAESVHRKVAEGDFLTAAEIAFQQLGAFRFNRFLRRQFRVVRPSDAELSVVRALWGLRPPLVLTTNYDDALLWGREGVEVVANDQDHELALMDAETEPEAPRVWHLHGTIHRLSTIILGGADYQRLYGKPEQRAYEGALARLHSRLSARPILYVGFSLNDPYVIQQIQHVLQLTKGQSAPSYALMKRGQGDRGVLWMNYNIQLIEYEDHGAPLAELLRSLARSAFGPQALSFSAEASSERSFVRRPQLEEALAEILRRQRRLVLLAPKRGGARTLARHIAERYGKRVTWLAPPSIPECSEAEYCRILAGDDSVTDFVGLIAHLRKKAAELGGEHLVVLRYEWGPFEHLKTLGNHLRRLLDESSEATFHVLVAGGIRSAWLIHNMETFSAFRDAPRREVADFTVEEVAQLLEIAGRDRRWAQDVHEATGGHLGPANEILSGEGPLDLESLTRRLAHSPVLRATVRDRLRDDDRNGFSGRRHARWVLEELLAGRPVGPLANLDHRTEHPEVRLYFDGLVRSDEQGRTVLRCRAAGLVAAEALARGDSRP